MIFSKKAILAAIELDKIKIEPFNPEWLGPAHVDLHLGGSSDLLLTPKEFLTVETAETIHLSNDICGFVEGRASLARQGLSVEQSSTFIEPGTNNPLTLELFNASQNPITLEAGQTVAKLLLTKVTDKI
ncbi:hypothetical protein HY003_00415 [Candidatus Saccharibacteria bacterium]|nr:hypothetical protein [Candidatus Saccharibacteria bacterium]MBI3337751.1 hypothetical protein [Candidatus Saccharibacteria bacterium]